jgi:hypothetical protein
VGLAPQGPQEGETGQAELESFQVEPEETEGAPFPPAEPSDRIPNEDKDYPPVPDGPLVGDLEPGNPEFDIVEGKAEGEESAKWPAGIARLAGLTFRDYAELTNSQAASSLCCPEVSVAENGDTVMLTGNFWMALSEDGGATFTSTNPTTIFPQSDGGFCCDQVIQYVPSIDMFVWLMQYWTDAKGDNRIRVAAQTTGQVRSSNGTAWTYWDFTSDIFDTAASLDYNDMSFGDSSLWWASNIGGGRSVVRISLSQLAAKGTLNCGVANKTAAFWSHVSHNAGDTVYWARHINNSSIRVYSMRDGDGFYSWRTVTVNSWPNQENRSTAPDGTDWLTIDRNNHFIFGNAVQGDSVWLGWLASAGDGFPQPHVQLARISTASWTRQEQVQVWNSNVAFGYPYLSTNAQGETGMSIGFGGGGYYPSHAVGVWGDYVVYYPRLSTRATGRWGDYNTCRRSGADGVQWVAGGYTMEKDASGSDIMVPHYIRFSR